ncbi:MAG TPA: hypothetical protein VE090_02305, partial [Methylomirabilota bacterium]|nr:hypothetical protein [Methylomirabilota bacterium]
MPNKFFGGRETEAENVELTLFQKFIQKENDTARAEILELTSRLHNPEGIDEERIEHFFTALGLQPADGVLVTDVSNRDTIDAAFKKVEGYSPQFAGGNYHHRSGLAVVYRYPYAPNFVQDAYIHEYWGHGSVATGAPSTLTNLIRSRFFKSKEPIQGFVGGGKGKFLEEGFSDWATATYNAMDNLAPNSSPYQGVLVDRSYLPQKYQNFPHYQFYGYGAMGWDVLIAHDPELIEPLLASRGDTEQMLEIESRIDRFHPHLFAHLRQIPQDYTDSDEAKQANKKNFQRGLGMILG